METSVALTGTPPLKASGRDFYPGRLFGHLNGIGRSVSSVFAVPLWDCSESVKGLDCSLVFFGDL